MSITKRTLDKWRKEALKSMLIIDSRPLINESVSRTVEFYNAFLRMTQELLDAHLIRKK